jgi:hypothetical protein
MKRSISRTLPWLVWAGVCVLPGCAAISQMLGFGPQPVRPKLLVLPFVCDSPEIGVAVAKGFKREVTSKIEALDPASFQLFLATRSAQSQMLPGFASLPGVPALSSASVPSNSNGAPPALSAAELLSDLPQSAQARRRLHKDGGIAYLVAGQAKQQIWSELEAANIKTAATASIRVWDLETDELLSEETFQQGGFEIVAPERIGAKLADRVNRRLNDIRREDELRSRPDR